MDENSYRLWAWCRRNPAMATLLVLVFALLTTVAVGSTIYAVRFAERNRENAALRRELESLRKVAP